MAPTRTGGAGGEGTAPERIFPSALAAAILADVDKVLVDDGTGARAGLRKLATLIRIFDGGSGEDDARPARGGLASWQRRRVEDYLGRHLDGPISVGALAAEVRLSPSYFCRAFKVSLGTTPHSYVTAARLRRAQELMLGTHDTLSGIACACGLVDQAHLSRLFRKHCDDTPLNWRRRHRRAA